MPAIAAGCILLNLALAVRVFNSILQLLWEGVVLNIAIAVGDVILNIAIAVGGFY